MSDSSRRLPISPIGNLDDRGHPNGCHKDNSLFSLVDDLERVTHNLRSGVKLLKLICRSVDELDGDKSDAINLLARGMEREAKRAETICEDLCKACSGESERGREIELANDRARFAKQLIESLGRARQMPKPPRVAS